MLIFLILFKCVYINGLVIIKTLGSILIFVERVWIFLKIKTGIWYGYQKLISKPFRRENKTNQNINYHYQYDKIIISKIFELTDQLHLNFKKYSNSLYVI